MVLLLTRLSTYFEGHVTASDPLLGVYYYREISELKEVRQFPTFFSKFQFVITAILPTSHVKVLIYSAVPFSKLALLSRMFDIQNVG